MAAKQEDVANGSPSFNEMLSGHSLSLLHVLLLAAAHEILTKHEEQGQSNIQTAGLAEDLAERLKKVEGYGLKFGAPQGVANPTWSSQKDLNTYATSKGWPLPWPKRAGGN